MYFATAHAEKDGVKRAKNVCVYPAREEEHAGDIGRIITYAESADDDERM